ncbi:MAG: hypothetical protein U0790_21780 [Isosphaeraceae bacterium]
MSRSFRHSSLSRCGSLAVLLGVLSGGVARADEPDTEGWKVVFSDRFEGDRLGDRWKATHGDWSIENGALKGLLRKKDLPNYDYHDADITLGGLKLASSVEVRYETWSPDEVGSEVKLLTEANDAGIIMAVLGVDHPAFQAKGAMAFFFKDMSYELVGRAATAVLTPREKHKVRLVRKDDQVSLFLDGKQVLSTDLARAKELGELGLHLVGTWGKAGSAVYFDNLEIRVPAAEIKNEPR